jgi:hypothetical protein
MGSQSRFEFARVHEEADLLKLVDPKTKIAVTAHKLPDNTSGFDCSTTAQSKLLAAQVSQTLDWKSTTLATFH